MRSGAARSGEGLARRWLQGHDRDDTPAAVAQREAIETLIFVWEYEKVRTRKDLLERYANDLKDVILPPPDEYARYCIKMATGSGKTKVMALALAWQFLNAQREADDVAKDYARTFLLLAPNVVVMERLRVDFAGGRIFEVDPIIPKVMRMFWEFDCVLRGEGERAHAEGTLFLSNIQQFYERPSRAQDAEPDPMTGVLGSRPPTKKLEMSDFGERIAMRSGPLLVINDEAHHTHAEDSEWIKVIRDLHGKTPITAQLDFSATPRFPKGSLFPWTISDYPLKQAILDQIVKWPMRGVANITEAKSQHASVKYEGFLVAGVERWKEYRKQLAPLGKKPILFIMLTDTDEAEDVGGWLRGKYPELLGGEKTLVIHTNTTGEISKADLDTARRVAREVDEDKSEVCAIVSVLMLREGWDVQNVTVVVGLRPYTAKANILPEQAIGRGLRLMFRDQPGVGYRERVDIIGNQKFLEFVDDLEKLEDIKLGTFEVGKDRLKILTVLPQPDRAEFDIGLPTLSPVLVRKKSLAAEIATLDIGAFKFAPIPMRVDEQASRTFKYEGFDVITLKKEIERDYTIPQPQTAQEVIGYYARRIAEQVKLPSQFAALAPKVREFFETRMFGRTVDLADPEIVRAMATPLAHYITVKTFAAVLSAAAIAEQEPQLVDAARMLSTCAPFPWSQLFYEAHKTVFNVVPCENELENAFAHFLDAAPDVKAFAKLPMKFGFSIEYVDENKNLRLYHPDFAAIGVDGTHYLLETKGQNTSDVPHKDHAATVWCENATALTGKRWIYCKVMEAEFKKLEPTRIADLLALA
jgi:type III restriction enzyme